jgi:hypothetical protein
LLRGDPLELVARELNVTAARLSDIGRHGWWERCAKTLRKIPFVKRNGQETQWLLAVR